MKKHYLLSILLMAALFIQACDTWEETPPNFEVDNILGYRPVYATLEEAEVKGLPPQSLENPGKIYVINDYLMIVDNLRGVHVYDNTNPENPVNKGFIQLYGSTDIAIRDNVLYADQQSDLLAVDISNPLNINLLSRAENIFPFNSQYPPVEGTYFECVDPTKGIVVGWEQVELDNPKCYR
jgi:hypothetical protein